jgi:hypothetical protein
VRDYHLDRRGVEVRRRAKLTRTNTESHIGILYSSPFILYIRPLAGGSILFGVKTLFLARVKTLF